MTTFIKDTKIPTHTLPTTLPITKGFINNIIEKPEGFIIPKNEEYSIEALKVTKELFDLGVKEEKKFFSNNKSTKTSSNNDNIRNPFEELMVDGIDNDLIWAEIELKNNLFSKFLNKQLIDIEKKVINQNYGEEVDDDEEEKDEEDYEDDEDEFDKNLMDIDDEEEAEEEYNYKKIPIKLKFR